MQSICSAVGTESFTRVRVGIGGESAGQDLVGYVLSPTRGRDRELMDRMVIKAADAVEDIIEHGEDRAMNEYNALKLNGNGRNIPPEGE